MPGFTGVRVGVADLVADRRVLLDAFAPPMVFVLANGLGGLSVAAVAALGFAVVRVLWRVWRREGAQHALAGLGGVSLSVALAVLTGEAGSYFLPGIVSGFVSGTAFLLSAMVGRPLLGIVVWLVYGWPLGWAFHPRVRPAFVEASLGWALLYLARSAAQTALLVAGMFGALTTASLLLGWPVTTLMALVTYAYVPRRLDDLAGPSIQEFRTGTGAARAGRVDRLPR